MKTAIKFICIMLSLMMLLSLAACNQGTSPEVTTEDPVQTEEPESTTTDSDTTPADEPEETRPEVVVYEDRVYNIADNLENIKVIGRSLAADGGISIDWSASGIEFNAECRGKVVLTVTSSEPCKLLISVDGTEKTVEIAKGTADYEIAAELSEGDHNIRAIKKNDNAVENTPDILTSVSKISMCGLLGERPADKKYLIEFIGDSITCGLGTVAAGSLETDATVTYAYKAAEILDVDYSFVSVSGIGVAISTEQNNGLVMSDIYEYTNYYRDQTAKYTPARKADVVVIALNTNDNGRSPSAADYNAKATALINSIKAIHGEDVKIVWATALMYSQGSCDTLAKFLLKNLGGEDSGYYMMAGTPDSSGAFTHPSAAGHAVNGEKLAKFIKDKGILDIE